MVWGSTMILKLTERFPMVITIGSAVLAWTSAKMIVEEPLIHDWFASAWIKYGFELFIIVAVVGLGTLMKRKRRVHLHHSTQS
ncbi:hypothetical protein D3C76_1804660 [compost metagenome]